VSHSSSHFSTPALSDYGSYLSSLQLVLVPSSLVGQYLTFRLLLCSPLWRDEQRI
jgi:hypothetical protein